ncbi:MAG TPA: glycosyltransferase [Candidatus Eisenbacteria bacterium]|jgi:glycosyltransferase involved in cell wall biosynthesis|nr:glycosyltransferase [Candidatus Eisenbacteria bacterium]
MKILHVVPSYLPAWRYGGTIRSVHALCRGLVRLGHRVEVFTTDVDGRSRLDVPTNRPVDVDGVLVNYFPSPFLRRLYFSPAMGRALERRTREFDLVHLHSVFLWPTAAAAASARRSGKPFIISPRGMLVKALVRRKSRAVKSAWIRWVERRNLETAAAIHATSSLEKKELEAFGFRLPPVFVVPNAVEEEESGGEIPDVLDGLGGRPVILFLGRINWKKGLDRLIPAMASVPQAELVIAGNDEEGYGDSMRRLADQKGVGLRVRFAGEVRGPRKWALLRAAAVLALPSYGENFGNVVLEAMSVGCPVIVSEEVGAADVVRESGAGRVVSGGAEELGRELAALLRDEALRRETGRRGIEAAAKFSRAAMAERMAREYERALGAVRS